MTNEHLRPQERANRLMQYLRRLKNNRGAMAELRCALSPSAAKRARAWPLLAAAGGIGNIITETVAGLFAYHAEEAASGNIGTTCLQIQKQHQTFDGRFRRLLACDRDEICERVVPVVLTAKAKDIPVNYEALFTDLCYWGDAVKARWAQKYWGASQTEEEPATANVETAP